MANKEFQVRHGLAVNNNVLVANVISGNVGIGTSTPNAQLELAGTQTNILRFSSSSDSVNYQTQLVNYYNSAKSFEILHGGISALRIAQQAFGSVEFGSPNYHWKTHQSLNHISANTAGVERLRIDNTGNVGIGTVSPTYKLDVAGSANFSSPTFFIAGSNVLSTISTGDAASNTWANTVGASANNWANTKLANTSDVYFAGNLNIPGKLYITSENSDSLRTRFISGKASTTTANGALYLNYGYSDPVHIGSGAVAANFYVANGNMGVGTVSPTSTLHVIGTANITSSTLVVGGANVLSTIYTGDAASNTWANTVGAAANAYATATYLLKSGGTVAGDLVVTGNVTISGNTTYANTQTLLIGDNLITLNADIPSNVAPSENAGIEVDRGSSANVAILWNEVSDKWTFTNDGTTYAQFASNTDVASVYTAQNAGYTTANAAFLKANNALPNTDSAVFAGKLELYSDGGNASLRVRANNVGAPAIRSQIILETMETTTGRGLGIQTKNATQENWFFGEGYGMSGNFTIGYGSSQSSYTAQSKFYITTAGDIGIGSSTPGARLDVKATDGTGLYIGTGASNYYDANVHVFRSTLQIERMRLDNAGNIGIGTSAPSTTLDVVGVGSFGNISMPNTPTALFVRNTGNQMTDRGVALDLVSPGTGLNVSGYRTTGRLISASVAQTTQGGYLSLGTENTSGTVIERMRIDANGNVAIGQTSAPERLSVFRDTDNSAEIGRAHVGFVGYNDYAGFSHVDMNGAGNYALLQDSTGGTYLNSASGQQIYFRNNNIDRMILTSAGNLGIGTTSPGFILDVQANTGGNHYVQVKNYGSLGGRAGIVLDSSGTSDADVVFRNQGIPTATIASFPYSQAAPLVFYTNNSTTLVEVARFNNSGYLGIGTSSISSHLDVAGTNGIALGAGANSWTLRLRQNTFNAAAGGSILFQGYKTAASAIGNYAGIAGLKENSTSADESGYLAFFTVPNATQQVTERMRIDSSGNVGIGTTAPGAKLDVSGDIRSTAFVKTDYIGNKSYVAGQGYINFTTTDTIFTFNTTEQLRLASSGNVGIGTTSPSAKLHVANGYTILADHNTQSAPTTTLGGTALSWNYSGGNAEVNFWNLWNGATGGGFRFSQKTGTSTFNDVYWAANTFHTWYTTGVERMRITSGGNIGIGTSSPITNRALTIDGADYFGIELKANNGQVGRWLQESSTGGVYFDYGAATQAGRFLNIRSSSTSVMYLDANGNVGIGVSAPAQPLHVKASSANLAIRVESNTNASYYGTLGFDTDGITALLHAHVYDLRLRSAARMTYSAGGAGWSSAHVFNVVTPQTYSQTGTNSRFLVSTGTFAPTANSGAYQHFYLNPIINQTGNANGNYTGLLIDVTETSAKGSLNKLIDLQVGGISEFYVANTGVTYIADSLGIGTTTPVAKLDFGTSTSLALGQTILTYTNANTRYGIGVATSEGRMFVPSGASITFGHVSTSDGSTYTERMRLDNAGNMGLGSTSPIFFVGSGLEIARSYQPTLRLHSTVGAKRFEIQQDGNTAITTLVAGDSGSQMVFGTANLERMRINAAGNVGIGTTSPDGSRLFIKGISTDAHQRALHLGFNGTMSSGANSVYISFGQDNPSTNQLARIAAYYEGGTYQGSLRFYTNTNTEGASPSERMRIASSGYVGIANTNPVYTLDVGGNGIRTSGSTIISEGASQGQIIVRKTGLEGFNLLSDAASTLKFYDTAGFTRMIIDSSGQVGIGTSSPSSKLEVAALNDATVNYPLTVRNLGTTGSGGGTGTGIQFISHGAIDAGKIYTVNDISGVTTMVFTTYNGEVMRLRSSRVGIGNTAPQANLHVYSNQSVTTNPIAIFECSSAGTPAIELRDGAATKNRWWLGTGLNTTTDGIFTIYDARQSLSRLNIDTSGNVCIGTTSSLYKLSVIRPAGTSSYHEFYCGDGTQWSAINSNAGPGAYNSLTQSGDHVWLYSNGTQDTGSLVIGPFSASAKGIRIDVGGNVSIGQATTTYKLQVNGSFAANTKSFVIDHPTKSGMKLRYGSLEGPENGVYVRGVCNSFTIELPDYWTGLVDEDTITVTLTPKGRAQSLFVKKIEKNIVHIYSGDDTLPNCYYLVQAERKDVEKLVVEFDA